VCSLATFESSGFFVLRTPLLPFDDFVRWGDSLPGTWETDVGCLRARLQEILGRSEIQHALFLASPSLVASIRYWKQDPNSKRGVQVERALVRYFARMCGRATPFGLMSGLSTGPIAEDEATGNLSLQAQQNYRVTTSLDYEYLVALSDALKKASPIAAGQRYLPNSSLNRIGMVWHYRETKTVNGRRVHGLITLQADDYLDTVIGLACIGATIPEFTAALRSRGIPEDDAREYLYSLVDTQVLVSLFEPLVTGGSSLDDLINQLRALPSTTELAAAFERVRNALAAIDQRGLGVTIDAYQEVSRLLLDMGLSVSVEPSFHVNMVKPFASGVMPAVVVNELSRAMRLMSMDSFSSAEEPPKIRAFREAFSARYGYAWIPLVEVLDEECGIGFGGVQATAVPRQFSTLHSILLRKLLKCAEYGSTELELDERDFPDNKMSEGPLPDAFSVRASIVAPSMEALRQGDFQIHLLSAQGPSGAALLGRFCHSNRELEDCVRRHLKQEEAHEPEAVYAEIVYLPDGKVGNIISRPVLREYEIVYLGRSGVIQEHQIPVQDLLVTVTPDERVLLYSRKLQKRIIPRLTAAHAFFDPGLAPLYQFLCYLQYQPRTNVPAINWGPLEDLPFLPRILSGRVILSPARWKISPDEVKLLATTDRRQSFAAVQALRKDRGLPRWVLYSEGTNNLPVDLDNPLSVDAFVHVLNRAGTGSVLEMCPGPDKLCVSGPEGRFHHELIVPFVRKPIGGHRGAISGVSARNTAIRMAPPGGTWLYAKLYGGPAALDDLLIMTVLPLARMAVNEGLAVKWFFIRHEDPEPHLRVRFHGSHARLRRDLFPKLVSAVKPLLKSGPLWKIQFDTYDREVDRYAGPQGMATAESVFCVDSEAVLSVLQALKDLRFSDRRLHVAALGVDRLFSDFGFDWSERILATRLARDFVEKRLRPEETLKKKLGDAFRDERLPLEALLLGSSESPAWESYKLRSAHLVPLIERLRQLEQTGRLTRNLRDIVLSYVHMHVNRVMPSTAAILEYTVYDFLARVYRGWLAAGSRRQLFS
jgi:thiopeptide-type bacteriocin biosynthesis protein